MNVACSDKEHKINSGVSKTLGCMAAYANASNNEHSTTGRQSACVRLQNIQTHGSPQTEQKS